MTVLEEQKAELEKKLCLPHSVILFRDGRKHHCLYWVTGQPLSRKQWMLGCAGSVRASLSSQTLVAFPRILLSKLSLLASVQAFAEKAVQDMERRHILEMKEHRSTVKGQRPSQSSVA